MALIENRLKASLMMDCINGDHQERAIMASQVKEAIACIEELREQLDDLRQSRTLNNPVQDGST